MAWAHKHSEFAREGSEWREEGWFSRKALGIGKMENTRAQVRGVYVGRAISDALLHRPQASLRFISRGQDLFVLEAGHGRLAHVHPTQLHAWAGP